jgi:hypothetical protein
MVTYAKDLSGIDMLILFGFHHLQFFGLIVHHPQCLIAAHLGVVVPMAIPTYSYFIRNSLFRKIIRQKIENSIKESPKIVTIAYNM